MPDLEISKLPALAGSGLQATDQLPVADLSAAETKKITAKDLVQSGFALTTPSSLDPSRLNWAGLAGNVIDGASLQPRSLAGGKLMLDTITAQELAPNAVGASELADNAVDTAAVADLAITNAKLAGGITSDKIVSLDGVKIQPDSLTAAQIAPNAIGSSELADGAVDTASVQDLAITNAKLATGIDGAKLIDGSVTNAKLAGGITSDKIVSLDGVKIQPGTVDTAQIKDLAITNAKLAGGITSDKIVDLDGTKIKADSLTAAQIAPDAITASELADGAVDTAALQNGAVTNDKLAGGINAAKLSDSTLTPAKLTPGSLDRGIDRSTGAIGHTNAIAAGTRSGITFDAQGHITGHAPLAPADLPTATATTTGVVSVPANSGLSVSGVGDLRHSNAVAAGTSSGISYDAHGHITGAVPLTGTDLPLATGTTVGGVMVPGPALSVGSGGSLRHDDSGVGAGTYPKVTVDSRGHVTAGLPLVAADIPNLDATKINTGVFDPQRIADRSIAAKKLDHYAISYIQEGTPSSALADNHIGQLWYQESTAQLNMWNGNSWMPVGSLGRLGTENMRFSGTWSAASGQIEVVTNFGKQAGLVAASALPTATDALTGVYLVTTTPGTHSAVAYDNGDWVLCLGATAGWVRVDTLSSAGASTIHLKDLLDVNITTPNTGDALIFDSTSNRWVNRPTAATKSSLSPAFDGIRTSFSLQHDAPNVNDLLISLGGVVQNPGVDYTLTGARTVNFAAPPPVGLDYWVLIEGVPSSSGGGGAGGTALPPGTSEEEVLGWNDTTHSWQPKTEINGGNF